MTSENQGTKVAADTLDQLLKKARSAAETAYAPYSRFRVGAAVLADGEIFTGFNVENASYGLTVCAERTAIFNAVTKGHRRIDAVAVACIDAAPDAEPSSRMPCGACRQVIAEFASPDTTVIVDGVGQTSLGRLLPEPFTLKTP
ncbi:cytidine deaminase [Bradyrhizobium commune]|uniref:cytidine deaminase n=1 Tax=Bradyrhizobium commune TaxID=83627 RepID=UPI001FEEB464|nr:cytidine deaminase [Bradyrhizobium commune]